MSTDQRAAHGIHLPDVRPLDHVRSIKTKLGVLVGATATRFRPRSWSPSW